MRIGQLVDYYAAGGTEVPAVARVLAVGPPGPSLYKTLCLEVKGKRYDDVPHARDSEAGGCWTLPNEAFERKAPVPTVADLTVVAEPVYKLNSL